MKLFNKSITYWLRLLHRDLGYIFAGICIIYGVSGFIISLKPNDKAILYKEITIGATLPANLDASRIPMEWKALNQKYAITLAKNDGNNVSLLFNGGEGVYNSATGEVTGKIFKKRAILVFFNKLHYNQMGNWKIMAQIFGVVLVFLAISGLFLAKGKYGFLKRGLWLTLLGVALTIAFAL